MAAPSSSVAAAARHRVLLLSCGPKPAEVVRRFGTFGDLIAATTAAQCAAVGLSAAVAPDAPSPSTATTSYVAPTPPPESPTTPKYGSRTLGAIEFTTIDVHSTPQPWLPEAPHAAYDAIILSGSKYNVTERHPFAREVARWLRESVFSVPVEQRRCWVLGICFGHQLLADTLRGTVCGGRGEEEEAVTVNPLGPELGAVPIRPTAAASADPLLSLPPSIASVDCFYANEMHWQTVRAVPPTATVLAVSDLDQHQMVRWDDKTYSVQFHPEYSAAFVETSVPSLEVAEDVNARIIASLRPTPESESIVARFLKLATRA